MTTEIAGFTRANEGIQGITWNILGQIYVPKSRSENSFSWHATFPVGTFVPLRPPYTDITRNSWKVFLAAVVAESAIGPRTGLAGRRRCAAGLARRSHRLLTAYVRGGGEKRLSCLMSPSPAGGTAGLRLPPRRSRRAGHSRRLSRRSSSG